MGARLRWLTLAAAATAALVLPASALGARVEPFETRTTGGLALRGHVHLPDGPGPFATALDFSPYWNGPAYGASGQPNSPDTVGMRFLLDAGFAVALVNMRGTGLSQDQLRALGGNLVAVLRHTAGDGSCDELIGGAADVGRAMLDLRHWASPGESRAFPVNRATRVRVPGQPSAVRIPRGHRLVLGVSGGAIELEPDPLHPLLSIGGGALRIPVVDGQLRFR